MYETEANSRVETIDQIPPEVVEHFRAFRPRIVAKTVLPWGEHCTECVWPTCYATCDLYRPREDGRCRRFIDGTVRIDCPGAVNSYLLKIRFKRWGKLWAPGNTNLLSLSDAGRREQWDRRIGSALLHLPVPAPVRNFAIRKRYVWKKHLSGKVNLSAEGPDSFVVECYNPSESSIGLSVTIRSADRAQIIPFQQLIWIPSGYHREEIPVIEISRCIDLRSPFSVDLTPNEIDDGTTLYFGLIDFVRYDPAAHKEPAKEPPVKCVVWDLDNTLWDGILVEQDPAKLVPKPGILDVIRELDRRGILNSVASKNNFDEAMAVLKAMGIDEYFLHPQISWNPKSEALRTIARRLNVGIDTLLFVDDSDFELAEVKAAYPEVRTLPAGDYLGIPDLPACRVPVTAESAARRKMYREESVRDSVREGYAGDYMAFLRDCHIEMKLEPLSGANVERVHELTQRTNQMNFSGRRYDRRTLEQIARTPHLDTYVITCSDRFGSYGIVGFSIVDSREPRMTDLMFSCRIQSKRVEHAFLAYLIEKYRCGRAVAFFVDYRKTPRNAHSGHVFHDLGMEMVGEREGVILLVLPPGRQVPNDKIVRIFEKQPTAEELLT